VIKFQHMDDGDKAFLLGSVMLPIFVWWYFNGRKKYGAKGLK
jgi:hypothetical protein